MKKRKTYEVSVINKTYSKTYSDETKFYTSDTALELNFQLKEVEYDFDSAEIILLNIDDRSLVTRPVAKNAVGFTYELEDDIVERYGEWKCQLKFNEGGEIYVSSPVVFRIENDLTNDRPPKLTEANTWKNLRTIADGLIADIRSELELVAVKVSEIEGAETTRQEAETQRTSAETSRVSAEEQREIDHANRSAELARKADKVVLKNLVENGDFTTYNPSNWSNTNGTVSTVDGKARFTLSANNGLFWSSTTTIPVGHKFYTRLKYKQSAVGSAAPRIRLSTTTDVLLGNNDTLDNVISGVSTNTLSVDTSVRFFVNVGTDNYVDIDEWMMIDLTDIFGVGNEPSSEEMEIFINETGYFNGSKEIAQLQEIYKELKVTSAKANKLETVADNLKLLSEMQDNNDEYFKYTSNGGLVSGNTITVPANKTANNTAIRWAKNIDLGYVGKKIRFYMRVNISDPTTKFYLYPPSIRFYLSVIRNGAVLSSKSGQISVQNFEHKYDGTNKSLYTFEYEIKSGDEILRPTIDINNASELFSNDIHIIAEKVLYELIDTNDPLITPLSFIFNESAKSFSIEDNSIKEEKLFFLPDYFDTEIKDTVEKIENLTTANSLVLSLLTDSHNDASETDRPFSQTAKTIQAVNELVNFDGIMHMGDLANGETNKATTSAVIRDGLKDLRKANDTVMLLFGNHDSNSYGDNRKSPEKAFLPNEWYARTVRQLQSSTTISQPEGETYFYKDYTQQKVRLIGLNSSDIPIIFEEDGSLRYSADINTAFSDKQVNWLGNEALRDIPEDWAVMVFSHIGTRADVVNTASGPRRSVDVEGTLKAFMTGGTYANSANYDDFPINVDFDFTTQGPHKLVGHFCGHVHWDKIVKPEDLGYHLIAVDCSKFEPNRQPGYGGLGNPRTVGTVTEEVWDALVLQNEERKLHMIRFGSGEDRVINY